MNDDEITPTDAQLARLADGTLPMGERRALRERADSDPQLAAVRDEQARAVALIRRTDEIVAPASLRASVRETSEGAAFRARERDPLGLSLAGTRWRRGLFMPAATALAIIVAAIVVKSSATGTPTVAEAARLALAPATMPAPQSDPSNRQLLDLRVGTVPFPAYVRRTGWQATGARRDTLRGRGVTTVFYRAADGSRVGYAIVDGRSLTAPDGPARTVDGVRYVLGTAGSATLVTWWRDGHTCVIAGSKAGDATLLRLATADEHVG